MSGKGEMCFEVLYLADEDRRWDPRLPAIAVPPLAVESHQ